MVMADLPGSVLSRGSSGLLGGPRFCPVGLPLAFPALVIFSTMSHVPSSWSCLAVIYFLPPRSIIVIARTSHLLSDIQSPQKTIA